MGKITDECGHMPIFEALERRLLLSVDIAFYDFADNDLSDWTVQDTDPASGYDYWGLVQDGLNAPQVWCAGNSDGGAELWNNYDNDMDAEMYRNFNLGGYSDCYLQFDYYLHTEPFFDYLSVELNGEERWRDTAGPINWGPGDPGFQKVISLSDYDDQLVSVKFRFHSDFSNEGYDGTFIDNIHIRGTPVPPNRPPMIEWLSDSPEPVMQPNDLTLTANNVTDPDGDPITRVEFYLDSDRDGDLDPETDERLGTDTDPSGGWTWTDSSSGLPTGINRYFARAYDGEAWSNVKSTQGTVRSADMDPPGNVRNFTATPGDGQITLDWNNPGDSDLAGALIIQRPGQAPNAAPTTGVSYSVGNSLGGGTVVHVGTDRPHIDSGLNNGTTYYYKAFAYDTSLNYAAGVSTSNTPVPPPPPPSPVLVVPGILGSIPKDGYFPSWLAFGQEGTDPHNLEIDPIGHSYDNLVANLDALDAYTLNENLFAAPYDWRRSIGLENASGQTLLGSLQPSDLDILQPDTGMEYLLYWINEAAREWQDAGYDRGSFQVDLVCHSMGGLLARSVVASPVFSRIHELYDGSTWYIQSGDFVDTIIMLDTPNHGATIAPVVRENLVNVLPEGVNYVTSNMVAGGMGKLLSLITAPTLVGPIAIQGISQAIGGLAGQAAENATRDYVTAFTQGLQDMYPTFEDEYTNSFLAYLNDSAGLDYLTGNAETWNLTGLLTDPSKSNPQNTTWIDSELKPQWYTWPLWMAGILDDPNVTVPVEVGPGSGTIPSPFSQDGTINTANPSGAFITETNSLSVHNGVPSAWGIGTVSDPTGTGDHGVFAGELGGQGFQGHQLFGDETDIIKATLRILGYEGANPTHTVETYSELTDLIANATHYYWDDAVQAWKEKIGQGVETISGAFSQLVRGMSMPNGPTSYVAVNFDPAEVLVTDSQGRRVGSDGVNSYNETPGAYYSGAGAHRVIALPETQDELLDIQAIGVGDVFAGFAASLVDGEIEDLQVFEEPHLVEGETRDYELVGGFAEIHGTVWDDANADGMQYTGENVLSGWTVFLDENDDGELDWAEGNGNGLWDEGEGEQWTVSDASGNYSFTGLRPGLYRVAEVLEGGWEQTAPDTAGGWGTAFFDNFDDGDYDGWVATHPITGAPTTSPALVSSSEGYSLRGLGSGYANDSGLNVHLTHPLSISDATEIKIEMRAKSGPDWPNSATAWLVNGSDYYSVIDYGESNQTADFRSNLADDYRYDIGERAHEWHDFAWSRSTDGWWSLSIDGQVEWANFLQDTQLTSFDKLGLQILRNQSEIEWVRVSTSSSGALGVYTVTLAAGEVLEGLHFGNRRLAVAVDDGVAEGAIVDEDSGAIPIDVLANDQYLLNPVSAGIITAVTDPANGTITIINDGKAVSYQPDANFNGQDPFDYTITDEGNPSTATVTVNVTSVNDAPSFSKGADQTVYEDDGPQSVSGWATDISPGPLNEAGQTVWFEASSNNEGLFSGQPAVASDGTLTYTPAPGTHGDATVTVILQDNGGTANGGSDTSDPQTFTITVLATPEIDITDDSGNATDWAVMLDDTEVGLTSGSKTFMLTNSGNGTVEITNFGGGSDHPDDFNVTVKDNGGVLVDTSSGSFDIAAGQSYTIDVTFSPSVSEVRSGRILFNTNDPDDGEDSIILTMDGTGTPIPSSPDRFRADVDWLWYQDNEGREIAYDFSAGTVGNGRQVSIPETAIIGRAAGEDQAEFVLNPGMKLWDVDLQNGVYSMSIREATPEPPAIPTAAITVDGALEDWSNVAIYAEDPDNDSWGSPASDIDYVKLAYSPDGARFNVLYKLTGPADASVLCELFLDKNLNGEVDRPGDYRVDVQWHSGAWHATSQGWREDGSWYLIDGLEEISVSSEYIEFSVSSAVFGLSGTVNVFGRTTEPVADPVAYDRFVSGYLSVRDDINLNADDLSTSTSEWSFAVRVQDFQNPSSDGMLNRAFISTDNDVQGQGALNVWQAATWFTGTYGGITFDNALVFDTYISGETVVGDEYGWSWNPSTGGGLVLVGNDPARTSVDLKTTVSSAGQVVNFYYRLNSASPDQTGGAWQFIVSHTLPPDTGTMFGLKDLFPNIGIETDAYLIIPDIGPEIDITDDSGGMTDRTVMLPDTELGQTSGSKIFTLTNSGNAIVEITNFGGGGDHPDDFNVTVKDNGGVLVDTSSGSFDIPAGQSYTIDVTFSPSVSEARSGWIFFNTNDPDDDEGSITLTMTGTGRPIPSSPDRFRADVDWLWYQDNEGREIAYDFSTGTVGNGRQISIPDSAVIGRAAGEEAAEFVLNPGMRLWDLDLQDGVFSMSMPHAASQPPAIPTAAIAVDGSTGDWAGVPIYAEDPDNDSWGSSGTDIDYVKLSYSPGGSRLNILYKLTGTVDTSTWYRLFLDKDLNGHVDEPGDYQVDAQWHGGAWEVVSQGWLAGDDNWYPVDELGEISVSGDYIELSVSAGAFGLSGPVNVYGRTKQSTLGYRIHDEFVPGYQYVDDTVNLNGYPLEASATEWSFAARVQDFKNASSNSFLNGAFITTENYLEGAIDVTLAAVWFTGMYEGTLYDNALMLNTYARGQTATGDEYRWSWNPSNGGGLIFEGYDPAAIIVDLKVDVGNAGQTVDFYYRLDNASADETGGAWQFLVSHTLPPNTGTMFGLKDLFPSIGIETNAHWMPTDIELSNTDVDENSPDGTVVGMLSGTDPNGDVLTFALSDDAGGRFGISNDTELVVANGSLLDYESDISHDITVEASDGEFTYSETFTISVTNVNEGQTYVVNSELDEIAVDEVLTLREAIQAANATSGTDAITFDDSLIGETITLGGTQLTISDDLEILGLGANQLTIDANDQSRVFYVNGGVSLLLDRLTITGGLSDESGGGIYNEGVLTVMDTTISGNSADGGGWGDGGGGIYNSGALTLTNSTVSGNSALWNGGGILNSGALTLTNTVVSGNSAEQGGGIWNGGALTLTNSTVSGNSVADVGAGIYNWGDLTLNNTIMALNDVNGQVDDVHGSYTGTGYLVGVDPSFVRNPSDGGDGWGDDPDTPGVDEGANDDHGDLRLAATSVAVDFMGDVSLLPPDTADLDGDGDTLEPIPLDLDGNPRVVGGVVDVGAYEYQGLVPPEREAPSLEVSSLADVLDIYDGAVTLREAILYVGLDSTGSEITFAPSLFASGAATVILDGMPLLIGEDMQIVGPGANLLTVDGDDRSRVFSIFNGEVDIEGIRIIGGAAQDGGGIFNDGGSSLTLTNVMISGNSAVDEGGGIYNEYGSTLTLTNTTVSGNSGEEGGGIYSDGVLTLTNSTVLHNSSTGWAGGICNWMGSVMLNNTVVALNDVNGSPDDILGAYTAESSFVGTVDGDPMLTAVTDAGGTVLYYLPLPGSPLIDAGDDTLAVDPDGAPLTTDQIGNPRVRGISVDIGAIEFQNEPQVSVHQSAINPANGHLYHVITGSNDSAVTWTDAENEAVALGGHLATINDAAENAWVTSTFAGNYLWIGLNDAASEGDFVWASGELVTYTNWWPGEPNDYDGGEDYVHIYNFSGGNYQWNDSKDIADDKWGLVEVEPSEPLVPIVVQSEVNPANGHAYHLLKVNDGVLGVSWTEAENKAIELGGHLVTINDAAENAWVKSTFFQEPDLWIGLNDAASEGNFVWASGEPVTYTNWQPGQPDNWKGSEHYVHISAGSNGRWNDNRNLLFAAVVEVPGDTEGPVILNVGSAADHGALGEVVLAIPDDGTFSDPRNGGIQTLLVEFSEAIDPASFTPASVQIAGIDIDGVDVGLSGIGISTSTRNGDTVGVIEFSDTLPDVARYIVRVEGVTDAAGNPLAGDNDRIMTALIGDAWGDLRVNNTDLGAVRFMRDNGSDPLDPTDANAVRTDVWTDGSINNTDFGGVRFMRDSGHDARFIPDPVLPVSSEGASVLFASEGSGSVAPSQAPIPELAVQPSMPDTDTPPSVLKESSVSVVPMPDYDSGARTAGIGLPAAPIFHDRKTPVERLLARPDRTGETQASLDTELDVGLVDVLAESEAMISIPL